MKHLGKLIIWLGLCMIGCQKSPIFQPPTTQKVDIYVAGMKLGNDIPIYLKNGIEHDMYIEQPILESIFMNSFAVSNGSVLGAFGSWYENKHAYVTVNQDIHRLEDASTYESIFLKGSDVYVAGMSTGPHDMNTRIWKNGTPILTHARIDKVIELKIEGSNIYELIQFSDKYFKNGIAKNLENMSVPDNWRTTSLTTKGNDVYISGFNMENGQLNAIYWKNGQLNYLPSNGYNQYTAGVAANQTDVYFLVIESSLTHFGNRALAYYKNNQKYILDPIDGYVFTSDITTYQKDVYIAVSYTFNNEYKIRLYKNQEILDEYSLSQPITERLFLEVVSK